MNRAGRDTRTRIVTAGVILCIAGLVALLIFCVLHPGMDWATLVGIGMASVLVVLIAIRRSLGRRSTES